MSHFSLPPLHDHSGWGPVPAAAPSAQAGSVAAYQPVPAGAFMFAELPFQPFNKNEKLWRVSDWASKEGDRFGRPQWGRRGDDTDRTGGILGADGVPADDAEGGAFSLVDNRPKLKPRYGKTTFKRGLNMNAQRGGRGGMRGGTRAGRGGMHNQRNQRGGRGGRHTNFYRNPRLAYGERNPAELRTPSVAVDAEWPLVLDIDMSNLGNFVADVDDGEDLAFAGALEQINPKRAFVTPRNAVNLMRFDNRQHFTATTSDDPVLGELRAQKAGNVYATDVILSALMAAPRSVNSWDILVRKEGDDIILDKRPASRLDFVSVNENAPDSYLQGEKDSYNQPEALSLEATLLNHNFAQQLVTPAAGAQAPPPHAFERPNPFLAHLSRGNEPASVAYRYRSFALPGGVQLVCRVSLNGFAEKKDGSQSFFLARALNEWDAKLAGHVDWRQRLEQQTGAVLASEMKNNTYKLHRWVGEVMLSGADELRLGFVSRANPKNAAKHALLMTKSYTPQTFADSVNVQTQRLWGTLAHLCAQVRKLDDGNYLMLRDPQKQLLHLYQVPADAFDHELDDMGEEED